MTIQEMHTAVKLELDKTSALELPAFEPEEIDFWLNNAIRRFVKTRYSGINVKGESFEETQKRIDDLRTIVWNYRTTSDTTVDDGSSTYPNAYIVKFPIEASGYGSEDYWLTVKEEAEITISGTAYRVPVTECTMDEYTQKLQDPFSEHILHYNTAKPLRISRYNGVYVITDGNYTVTDYFLTYLGKPDEVDLSGSTHCNLPEHTHDEIVKLTASMMLENVEQPRYQTHMNEVNSME
jgi:hypothetical protein